jgi:hypothetical protein
MLGNVLVLIFDGGEQANALEAPVAIWLIKLASSINHNRLKTSFTNFSHAAW